MTDGELRAPLIGHMERVVREVAFGRHGDPHLAVTVLLYPDREPAIIVIRPDGSPFDITQARETEGRTATESAFRPADFEQAAHALSDARFAFRMHPHRRDRAVELGTTVGNGIAEGWRRRAMAPIERALADADYKAKYCEVCPTCQRRFTKRGLPMHLARSKRCSVAGT